ncbi:hypothetical protein H0H87_010058 [Tephrocybe sp. NHM501043]|nr:hypothetical protein H0H87_010058 [Tephrocybe sp. NHM501043]
MTIASKSLRKLRIIAIPLTRPKTATRPDATVSRMLTYYQFQIGSPQKSAATQELENGTPRSKWIPEGGIMKWVTTKAGDTWAGFGKAKGGWKLKVYQGGERLVDRLDFEELALKGIDPSLGPSIAQPDVGSEVSKAVQHEKVTIPLIYPPSINSGPVTLAELRALVAYRTPRHRKGFYIWMVIAPFTAPFMIIPIIPNIPFFFCAWRSWSHYKAYKASQYLQTLIDNDSLVPEPSEALDTIYKDFTPDRSAVTSPNGYKDEKSESASDTKSSAKHDVLLTRDAIPSILDIFNLKPSSASDLLRAVEQARVRVLSGRGVL